MLEAAICKSFAFGMGAKVAAVRAILIVQYDILYDILILCD